MASLAQEKEMHLESSVSFCEIGFRWTSVNWLKADQCYSLFLSLVCRVTYISELGGHLFYGKGCFHFSLGLCPFKFVHVFLK